MATVEAAKYATVEVCPLEQLQAEGFKVVSVEGHTILVLLDQGKVYALDNRCPHMGFPLHRGTVGDGILTCHWHHAKFDLAGGCTFDPFADDVTSFYAEIKDGMVWLDPAPIVEERLPHWRRKLDEGLKQNIRLVLAKSVIGLSGIGHTEEIVRQASLFGVRNRADGWTAGLSILTAMANVAPFLNEDDRPLALYHGVLQVAGDTANEPPNFDLGPLDTSEQRPERYLEWFRRFVDLRSANAAERTLRTAIRIGLEPKAIADMIFAACTDHLFLGGGHSLDFANKAFELLDHVSWEYAEEVLPSLIPRANMIEAPRMEETSAWRHPVDLAGLLTEVYAELDSLIAEGGGRLVDWQGHEELAEQILDGSPKDTLSMMVGLVRQGAPLTELSAAVAYAAARRAVHFRVTNEFSDWDTIHHSFTYANAVDQAMRRAPSNLLARGIFDGAMSVYLERFLNVPKQAIPAPLGRSSSPDDLLQAFDGQGQVDDTAQWAADMIAEGQEDELARALGHALLREDAGFHMFQIFESGIQQYRNFAGRPAGAHILLGVARFLSAHSPTVRARGQTYDIAARLLRGESLHGED